MQLTDVQWEQWRQKVGELENSHLHSEETYEADEFLREDHLTNPILNRRLQAILDDEHSDTYTRKLLLAILRTSRHILNEGTPVRQLVELGKYLKVEGHHIDYVTLGRWIKNLHLQRVIWLEGTLLTEYLGLEQHDAPFDNHKTGRSVESIVRELVEFTNTRSESFYFTQDPESIFVRTSNGSAMLRHIRRSARYFRYYPSETLTNFFASFAHSHSHIEE